MIEIGQLLRQARDAKGLSLADVEQETHIRQRYLNSLETGDWDELPNPVAARGFLRTYAHFLGLDAEELVDQAQEKLQAGAVINGVDASAANVPSEYRPINLDLYSDVAHRGRRTRRLLGIAAALISIIILGYLIVLYGLPYLRRTTDGEIVAVATVTLPPEGIATEPVIGAAASPTAANTAVATLPPTDTPTPKATDTPTLTPSPTLTPTPMEEIRVRARVTSTAWIRVVADGQVVVESMEDPGFEQDFIANRQLEFLTGNAGGVHLSLNDDPLPRLGDVGQVVLFIWGIQDGQVVELTPTPKSAPSPHPNKKTATPAASATTPAPTATSGG
ncbi:MAG: hypothetical protein DSY55_04550 [Clostridia bacterium]|nr:MAG: hypothetical protein DSY55_04550 [Clostridia bacterium]